MILVTGATGNVGSILVPMLKDAGLPTRAMTRDASRAKGALPTDTDIVEADFTDPDSLATTMSGVSTVVLISPAHPDMVAHQCAVLDAAEAARVSDVVKLSGLGASLDAPFKLPNSHARIEDYAKGLALRLTSVRPNLFMQVLSGDAASIAGQGKIYAPAGDGKISFTDARDVAAVITAICADPELRGTDYDITGPEALTYAQAAHKIGLASGYPVEHVDVDDATAREAMLGMGPWVAEAFVELFQIYRAGYGAAVLSETVGTVLGRSAHSFDAFAHDMRTAFAKAC